MKFKHILGSTIIAASSVALFASSDTDNKIEEAAKASYNYRTLLENKVTVKSNDGIVTLTGAVDDRDLKGIAEDTVSNLPGVLQVDNKISLDKAVQEHSDAWIALKLRYQLLVHASVSYRDTKVDVREGYVILTGTASTTAEKELVGIYASEIEGVKSVKNEITIVAPASDYKTVSESIDDASITSQVKFALVNHKSTSALKTKVTTNDGVVSISGKAGSSAERSLVTKLAKDIRGVKSVTNDMNVTDL